VRTSERNEHTTGSTQILEGRLTPLTPSVFFRDVLPLGAGVLLSALYFRIDLFFIERWHGLEPVGAYNAAFRLVEAMRLLPAAVMAVTFPLLVQTTDTRLVQKIGGSLAIAGVLLAALCTAASSWIVTAVYGVPYGYAAPAFAVLSLALPLFFLNYALTHQVIGWDGQRAYLRIAGLALVANVAANVALVPSQGMIGAAIATVITELVVTAGCLQALRGRHHASDFARSTSTFAQGASTFAQGASADKSADKSAGLAASHGELPGRLR
jgi:O-antigen/teichoic acid export membrane protein